MSGPAADQMTGRRTGTLIGVVLLSLLFAACGPAERLQTQVRPAPASPLPAAQVVFYLNGPATAAQNITCVIDSAALISEDGVAHELLSGPATLNAPALAGRQMLLAERPFVQGKYTRLRLRISKASLSRADLSLPSPEVELPVNVMVETRKTTPLFLSWNADASVAEGYLFRPAFSVAGRSADLRTLMLYVTNEYSHNVSVINRQRNEVVDTILVGKNPRGIAVNTRRERLKVYVTNTESNSLSVIDPNTNTVETEVPLRFGREPVAVAVAQAPSRDYLFIANSGSHTVTMLDAATLEEIDTFDVGKGPAALAVDPPRESFFAARFLSPEDRSALQHFRERFFHVYVANRNSKSVSVLRVDQRTGRVESIVSLDVQWEPVSLLVDAGRGLVYVVNYGFDVLSAIRIPEVVRGNLAGAVISVNNVGIGGMDVAADPGFDRLYLLRETSEVQVMRVAWENTSAQKAALPSLLSEITVGDRPRALLFDPEVRKLYVANRGSDDVSVIDKTTRRQETTIPVGRMPYAMAVFAE